MADTLADHTVQVQRMKDELEALQLATESGSKSVEEAVLGRQAVEEKLGRLEVELEAAREETERVKAEQFEKETEAKEIQENGVREGGEEEKRLRKVIEDLRDEMDGTKMVCCRPTL